jgi:phosphate transport system protein
VQRKFETELLDLKEKILKMGGLVEASVEAATTALITRDANGFKKVYEHEKIINSLHIEVDDACLNVLALQAPLAADLRLVIAVVKINNDLERMGDQAVNISYSSEHYLSKPPAKAPVDLPQMASQVRQMVRNSLDAFVKGDIALAQKVLEDDDVVDRYKYDTFKKMKQEMKQNPDLISSCLDMILIARNLERLADHATNIAEDVIFVYTGRDVRHGIGR